MQISNLTGASSPSTGATDKAALEKAAKQFEAIFLRQMIGAMRSSSQGEGLLDSSATEQFRDMADARTADSMAEKGSLGIAELLLRQFGGKEQTPAAPARDKSA
ncbi:MAG: rod-binding protein [Sphingobium sp.]